MSEPFPEPKSSRGRVKVELDLPNYAIKADLKKCNKFKKSKKFKQLEK